MFARNLLRLVATHLARCDAASLAHEPDPVDDGTDSQSELLRRPVAGHAAALNRGNHPFAKVHGVRFARGTLSQKSPA